MPRHMLKISMTPNCTLLIPSLVAIGRKIGVKIRMAGVISINIPTTRRMIFMSKKITYLLEVSPMSPEEIAWGIPA